jgi:stage V sporulation protein D (sporulation-specific penicillin-binding protein)
MSPNPPVKTLADVLAESLNTGIAQVGIKLGPSNFIKHIKAFGFGEKTEVGLPGESAGIVREVKDWNPPDVGMITFGQAIAVTPLQLTAAISAIANDGNLVRPRIINKIESLDGKFVKSPGTELLRRVISSSTAAKVKGMMEGVVYKPNGTARRTKMSRWKVAAKTGTAQKPAPGGGYMEGHYIASLVGFLPSDNPQLTILVVVDDPKGTYWGETVAAPVFKEVAEETLRYLNVP